MEVRQIIQRADSAANWGSVNPVLAAGELGIELDTLRIKVGDGSTAWNGLGYAAVEAVVSRDGTTVTVTINGVASVLPAATTTLAGLLAAADKGKLDGISAGANVVSTANTAFTGSNSFANNAGQSFTSADPGNDGIVLRGRTGGNQGYRVTLTPQLLSGNRELLAPDRSGVLITDADVGTVSSAMVAPEVLDDGGY